MKLVPILLLILFGSGCAFFPGDGGRVTDRTTVPDLLLAEDAPRYLICGHRGDLFGSILSEGYNTVESFERARLSGADLIEADIAATENGVPVVSHSDPGDEDDLDLATALSWAAGRVVLVLDLKTDEIARVVAEVRKAGAVGRVVFYANRSSEYEAVRAAGRDLYVMVRAKCAADVDRWIARGDPTVILVHADCDWLDADTLAKIHASGRRAFVNSYKTTWHQEVFGAESAVALVFAAGIDIAQTNAPASAARTRDSFK